MDNGCELESMHSKLNQNPLKLELKSAQNLSKIDKNRSWGRFGSQVAPEVAPGRLQDDGVSEKVGLFGRKCCSKGRFWEPWKIENGSKIALLSIGRHFYPLKTASGSGSWKNMKI